MICINLILLIGQLTELLGIIIWPSIILIIFLFLRTSIKSFLSRIKRIGYKGAGIEAETSSIQGKSEEANIAKLGTAGANENLKSIKGLFTPETLEYFRNIVLNATNVDAIEDGDEREEILSLFSQLVFLAMEFNKTYCSIYGSQLKIFMKCQR